MWYRSFRSLADDDLAAVIVYLRTLAPVRNPLPPTQIPPERAAELEVPEPILEPVPMPDLTDPVARARYYVLLADCGGCHTSWYTPRNPGFFAGGNPIDRAGGTVYSANITRDPSGIPYYDESLFREVMRSGRVRARELNGAMPWVVFRHLSDEDLDAIFRLFRDLVPPARHAINNLDPPTDCVLCGGKHPLGDRNRPLEVRPVTIDPALAAELVGRYRFEDGFEIILGLDGGRLTGRYGDSDKVFELFTEDGRSFRASGEPDVLVVQRDAGGRVVSLLSSGVYVAERLP
jgi:mono/diheme cytochrome c family protein